MNNGNNSNSSNSSNNSNLNDINISEKDYCLIYVPYPSLELAKKMAYSLVEGKFVACANIISPITSIYTWEGKVEEANEVVLIAKSRTNLFPKIKSVIEKAHPYSCPCIVSIYLADGNASFLKWIDQVTLPA